MTDEALVRNDKWRLRGTQFQHHPHSLQDLRKLILLKKLVKRDGRAFAHKSLHQVVMVVQNLFHCTVRCSKFES
jgi:hypothetical protein